MKRWILACMIMLVASVAQAATIYVDNQLPGADCTSGNYNTSARTCTGSAGNAYNTLQEGHDVAIANDTILVRGGTTYAISASISITRDGSSGNLIKLWNYPSETPIIDGATQAVNQTGFYLNGGSWWHIKGLEIKNTAHMGIRIGGGSANNIIENNNVHHCVRVNTNGAGIHLDGTDGGNNLILNNDSHHHSLTIGGTGGDGIAITGTSSAAGASGNVARGNRAWRNNDDGFDLSWSFAVTVEGNWSWENGFDDALVKTPGNGNGFKLGLTPPPSNGAWAIRNNLAWGNAEGGFNCNQSNTIGTVYNNTSYGNQEGMFGYVFTSANCNVGHLVRNNISVNDSNTYAGGTNTVHDHNTWDASPAVTANASDFVTTSFTANLGARQSDGSLPVSDFLKLASGSDLIDKGVDVGLSFNGSAPDMGAYEFAVADSTAPAAPTNLRVVGP